MATGHIDPNYTKAGTGLLDILETMRPLPVAAVRVAVQAVYEHTRQVDNVFALPPATFDADLAFVPELLVHDPKILDAMSSAGSEFVTQPFQQPGMYRREHDNTEVDPLATEIVRGREGRGANLGIHSNLAARQDHGLEGASISQQAMAIGSLSTGDDRSFELQVAGAVALQVAKKHKLADRAAEPGNPRLNNKDAFNLYSTLYAI